MVQGSRMAVAAFCTFVNARHETPKARPFSPLLFLSAGLAASPMF